MRARRRIISGRPYELTSRVQEGLPFPPNETMNLLLKSAIARVQRNNKVTLCTATWMANHVHMILIAKDAAQCVAFYAEVQKALTDLVKRLLGLKFLHLWEGRPTIAEIGDADKMVQRIAYFYANPSRANLVDSIEQYPGVSSYRAFKENFSKRIESSSTEIVPWIRPSKIKPLGTRSISAAQDRAITRELIKNAKIKHQLTYYPNAWMKCFGFNDSDVEDFNKQIESRLLAAESLNRQERNAKGYKTFGIEKLKAEPILKPHTPAKKERKIFFLASTIETRLSMLEAFREFDAVCRACYQAWRRGEYSVSWPPGAFRPPMGISANAIC